MSKEEQKLDNLQQQLATLEELFQEVASLYEKAAVSLREGLIPEKTPGFQLDAARKVFGDTLATLSALGEEYGIAPVSQPASLPSATDYLSAVLEAKEERERQQKLIEDAHFVLSEARLLKHDQDPDALSHIHDSILQLTNLLEQRDLEEAERLVKGDHPISMLVSYAAHRDSLSDEEYDSFRDHIESHFGRSVLRDIDRGRITASSTVSYTNEVIIEEEQEDTQNEIIEIVEEPQDEINGFSHPIILDEEAIETEESSPESMDDGTAPFWPLAFEDETSFEESREEKSDVDEDFNSEEDTISGQFSEDEQPTNRG